MTFAPSLVLVLVGLVAVGGTSIALRSLASSILQIAAADAMRGRLIALFAVATGGTRPLGAPVRGWIGETLGPRPAFALGGIGTAVATATMVVYLRRRGVKLSEVGTSSRLPPHPRSAETDGAPMPRQRAEDVKPDTTPTRHTGRDRTARS